jgi:hypothetical protein
MIPLMPAPWWPQFLIGMAIVIALAIIFDPTDLR